MSVNEPWWKTLVKRGNLGSLAAGFVVIYITVTTKDEKLSYLLAGTAIAYLWKIKEVVSSGE